MRTGTGRQEDPSARSDARHDRRLRVPLVGAAMVALASLGLIAVVPVAAGASARPALSLPGVDATTTVVTSSSVDPEAGSPITFTATVASLPLLTTGAPTGTVTFSDSAGTLCSASPLAAGTSALVTSSSATCVVTTLTSTGSPYTITAAYTPASGSSDSASSGTLVQVVLAAGTSPTSALAPTVTALSPTDGPAAGGTTVTITGTNLLGATAVDFGSLAATDVSATSDTSITAVSPADTAGAAVDVVVTTATGASVNSADSVFTYEGPLAVTSVTPSSGPVAGGTTVTLGGTDFTGATKVDFGSTAATSFTLVSATDITAVTPAGTSTVDVTVTTPAGTSVDSDAAQFTYTSAVTPTIAASSRTGRGDVTVSGTATPDSTVDLYERAYGAASVSEIGSTTAGSGGAYSFSPYIRRTAAFVTDASSLESPVAVALVTDKPTLSLKSTTKHKVTATVGTDPTLTGVEVTVYRVGSGGGLTKVKAEDITKSSGTVAISFTSTRTSPTFEAKVATGDGAVGATTAKHTVKVKQ